VYSWSIRLSYCHDWLEGIN